MSSEIYLVLAIIFAVMALWLHLKLKMLKSVREKSTHREPRVSRNKMSLDEEEDELDEFFVAFLDEDEDEENE